MRYSLTDLRGAAASRAGLITHHSAPRTRRTGGLHTKAEPLLIEGYGQMNPLPASANRKREALERIIRLYEAYDKPDEAVACGAKLKAHSDPARAEVTHEAKAP